MLQCLNTVCSVQLLSCVWLLVIPWTAAHQVSPSITNSQRLLKLMSINSVMPSNHLILCRPLLLTSSIFPSIRVFSKESALHIRWPRYRSFIFIISPSNEYSGLIWSPCSPRDSQESSPTPQFKSESLYSSPWYLETRVGLSPSLSEIKLSYEVIHTTGDTSTIYVLNFSNRLTHQPIESPS